MTDKSPKKESKNSKKSKYPKGILKSSSSIDESKSESKESLKEDIKWDEISILATLHPIGKDYGHMKVDEPKTPFPYDMELSGDLDPGELTTSLVNVGGIMSLPADLKPSSSEDEDNTQQSVEDDEGDDDDDSQEVFRKFRRKHYNEGKMLAFGKKLAEKDLKALKMEEKKEAEGRKKKCSKKKSSRHHSSTHSSSSHSNSSHSTSSEASTSRHSSTSSRHK
ncbi:unnamed protein product [Gordionus sp. m RMFG-2023]|uniref:protein phosphatase inhibitor 2-like n=1 Tax=Gordionus sp. m RMFG-2023 TaxID=3053472 RepID=UPI0030E3CB80